MTNVWGELSEGSDRKRKNGVWNEEFGCLDCLRNFNILLVLFQVFDVK